MTNLPNRITYLNEIPFAETTPLEKVSEDLGLPLEQLLSEIIRLNAQDRQIDLYTQITEHTIEFDKWAFEDDQRMHQSSTMPFMAGDKTTNFVHQSSGLARLSDDHKFELSFKESIRLTDIWSNKVEYISLTKPIEVLRKKLLIGNKHAQQLTSEITPALPPIKDSELIEYIKSNYSGNTKKFLDDVLKLKDENEDLNHQVKQLKNFTSEEEPENKHNLYGIIAGLLVVMSKDSSSTYLTGTKKPIEKHIAKRITQIAASKAMPMSTEEAIRKVFKNAREQLNSSN